MIIGNKNFDTDNDTYIMGILNVTPDSFSDGGRFNNLDAALRRVEEMLAEGADIIDVGGESTRPGHTVVSEEEEAKRVLPVIKAVKSRFDVPLSVDTYKSGVAAAAIEAGADMINDIWGLKHDADMARVIAESRAACCLMHNRRDTDYADFAADFKRDMAECLAIAEKAGIARDKIVLDPGVGFAKGLEQNLEVIGNVELLAGFGLPMLLGTSRKSFIGRVLGLDADERLEGTLVTTVTAVQQGYAFVRVHDIKENHRAIKMAQAIMKGRLYG